MMVAVAVAGAPTAVTRGSACTVAARVTHPPMQIDAEVFETASKLDLEAWKHGNSSLALLLLLKARMNGPNEIEENKVDSDENLIKSGVQTGQGWNGSSSEIEMIRKPRKKLGVIRSGLQGGGKEETIRK